MEKERSQKQDRRAVLFLGPESSNEKRLAKDGGQRSKKWDRQTVPFLGPHLLLSKRRPEKYYEQEDDYAEDSEQNEPGEFEGSPFMRLALHDM